jgi:hypothetical protein
VRLSALLSAEISVPFNRNAAKTVKRLYERLLRAKGHPLYDDVCCAGAVYQTWDE